MNTSPNPYAPPRARVQDAIETVAEYGPLNPFTVQGRIGRLRMLAWVVVLIMAGALTGGIGAGILAAFMPMLGDGFYSPKYIVFSIISIAFVLGILLCAVRIYAQRLHDIGLSAWFSILFFIPYIGQLCFLIIALYPGQTGINRYGPPQPPNSLAVRILAAFIILPVISIILATALPIIYRNSLSW